MLEWVLAASLEFSKLFNLWMTKSTDKDVADAWVYWLPVSVAKVDWDFPPSCTNVLFVRSHKMFGKTASQLAVQNDVTELRNSLLRLVA